MGLDIQIYKRSNGVEEIGEHLYSIIYNSAWELIDFLKKIDKTNHFKNLGIGIYRLNKDQVIELSQFLEKNRANNFEYDIILEVLETNKTDLFIYASW